MTPGQFLDLRRGLKYIERISKISRTKDTLLKFVVPVFTMQLNMYNLNCPMYKSWYLHYTGMIAFSTGNFTYCSTAFPKHR